MLIVDEVHKIKNLQRQVRFILQEDFLGKSRKGGIKYVKRAYGLG